MKKISHYITLKFISLVLISLILVMTSIQIASMLKIKSDVLKIQTLWDEVQVEQSEKLRLENAIRTFLGFGGMIHKLKNAILSDNIDPLDSIKSDIHSVETIIHLYLSFQLSNAERYALNDIATVVKKYQQKVDKLPSLFKQNVPRHKLDQFMRINDKPALRGLAILAQYNRHVVNRRGSDHSIHADKFFLLTDLVAQLGYGGLIHHIKNLELRADSYYAIESQNKIDEIRVTLKKFHHMPLTLKEEKALSSLMHTTNFYQTLLNNLKQPIDKQNIISQITMQRSDDDALKALQVLHQHIEVELKGKIFEVGEKIHSIQSSINTLIKLIIFLSIGTLLFFTYIMFKKVIIPLQNVTASMVLLARQRHKKEIHFTGKQIFEIKQMIRSIRIFKKNEVKRRHTEKSLTKMNNTTLQQLNEIKELQNRSEQKTEQALSLANHLIELQKSAEFDRNNALENQRRVNTILNTVNDAIITTDNEGVITSINTATEVMLGYREPELLGKNITLLMPSDIAEKHPQIIRECNEKENHQVQKSSREQVIKRADGSTFPVEIFLGQSEFNNEVTFTAVIRDITQRKKDEEAIQHLVLTDPLTNLANRRHFNQELKRSMQGKNRLKLSVGLLMIDLDNFKPINDTYGHNIGDKVLQRVSSRLQNITRNVDLIARLGGDEFAIILNSVNDKFDPVPPAQKIIDTLSKPMNIDGQMIKIGTTVGISVSPQDAVSLEDFINHADKALYKAKSLGKGQYFSYQDLADDEK
ncbi:diguanylate cyclase domain-containing protein [Psychromonas hadalis]|uniref:diguanylate cyclase domain-containing protein n=1 Tax=Psychromonas hadalis TaxID=211669 RepID=UPI0003B78E32|nr:diguanylate cyclase [Psychromonas hadalis]